MTSDGPTGPGVPAAEDDTRRRVRDRHGRGMRGPGRLPDRPGRPLTPTARERFDATVLDVVREVEARWADRLGLVEYAVEDVPELPDGWTGTVPLSSLVRGVGTAPTRLVLFRRPIEQRCELRSDLEAAVVTVVAEDLAELLGVGPEEVHPRYDTD